MENNNITKSALKEKIGSVVYVVNKAYTSYIPLHVKKITEKYVHFEESSTKISVDDINERIFFTLKDVKEAIKNHNNDNTHSIEEDIMDKNEYSKTRYIVLKDNTIYEGLLMKKFIVDGEKYLEYLLKCGVDCFGIRGTTTILENERESYVFETKEEAILEVVKRKRKAGEYIYVVDEDYSSIKKYSLYGIEKYLEDDTLRYSIFLTDSYPSENVIILTDLNRLFFTEDDAKVLVAQKAADKLLKRVNDDGSIKSSYILGDDGKIYEARFDGIIYRNSLSFIPVNNKTERINIISNFFNFIFDTKREAEVQSILLGNKNRDYLYIVNCGYTGYNRYYLSSVSEKYLHIANGALDISRRYSKELCFDHVFFTQKDAEEKIRIESSKKIGAAVEMEKKTPVYIVDKNRKKIYIGHLISAVNGRKRYALENDKKYEWVDFKDDSEFEEFSSKEAAELMLDLLKLPSKKSEPSIEAYRVDYNPHCNRFEINQHDITPEMYQKVTNSYINHESVEYVFLDMENAIEYARYLNNMKQVIRIPTLGEKVYIIDPTCQLKYTCGVVINITGYNMALVMIDSSIKMFSLLEIGYALEEPSKEEAATLSMYITTKFEASLQKNKDGIYKIPVLFSVEKDFITNKRFTVVTCGFDTMKECNERIESWIKNDIKFFFSFNEPDKYASFMNMKLSTDKLLNNFNASFRIKEIKDNFENLVKDGFEIGTVNGKFYIKNPNMCDMSDISSVYAEIDLLALSNEKINFIEILKYRKPVYVLTIDPRPDDYKSCTITCFYPALINTDSAILKVHPMYQIMNSNALAHQTIVVYKKDLNSKFFLSAQDATDYFNKNYRNK